MNKKEVIEALLKTEARFIDIENRIGMPRNNLSRYVKSSKIPDKWVRPIEIHLKAFEQARQWELDMFNKMLKGENIPDYSNVLSKIDQSAGDRLALNKMEIGLPSKEQKPPEPPAMTLQMVKDMCPKDLTGFDRSEWISKKRVELGI